MRQCIRSREQRGRDRPRFLCFKEKCLSARTLVCFLAKKWLQNARTLVMRAQSQAELHKIRAQQPNPRTVQGHHVARHQQAHQPNVRVMSSAYTRHTLYHGMCQTVLWCMRAMLLQPHRRHGTICPHEQQTRSKAAGSASSSVSMACNCWRQPPRRRRRETSNGATIGATFRNTFDIL